MNPYRDKLPDGPGDGPEPEKSHIDPGPLRTPHYELCLEDGAGMLTELTNGVWCVRFVYDPVSYELEAERLTGDAKLRPPLVFAIGDPGESRESVRAAFLDAVCAYWCRIVDRLRYETYGVGRVSHILGHPQPLSNRGGPADIWAGDEDCLDFDLLSMVHTARSRYHPARDHIAERVRAGDERSYFLRIIPEWRKITRPRDR